MNPFLLVGVFFASIVGFGLMTLGAAVIVRMISIAVARGKASPPRPRPMPPMPDDVFDMDDDDSDPLDRASMAAAAREYAKRK